MRVELSERKKREEILRRYGLLKRETDDDGNGDEEEDEDHDTERGKGRGKGKKKATKRSDEEDEYQDDDYEEDGDDGYGSDFGTPCPCSFLPSFLPLSPPTPISSLPMHSLLFSPVFSHSLSLTLLVDAPEDDLGKTKQENQGSCSYCKWTLADRKKALRQLADMTRSPLPSSPPSTSTSSPRG
jgi:hypothetical protein